MNINDEHTMSQMFALMLALRDQALELSKLELLLKDAARHDVDGAEDALYNFENLEAKVNIVTDTLNKAVNAWVNEPAHTESLETTGRV